MLTTRLSRYYSYYVDPKVEGAAVTNYGAGFWLIWT